MPRTLSGLITAREKLSLLRGIKKNVIKYSMQVYSSNVVEAALASSAISTTEANECGEARYIVNLGVLDLAMEMHGSIFLLDEKASSPSTLRFVTALLVPNAAQHSHRRAKIFTSCLLIPTESEFVEANFVLIHLYSHSYTPVT